MIPPRIRLLASISLCLAALGPCARSFGGPPAQLKYQETTLDNGLRVISLEDFSSPIVNVQVWYHVGSKDEQPDRQGFAHMFEHMMFRGTDRLGPTDHFDLIRRSGGYCNAYTSFDQTVYYQVLPAAQIDLAFWLEAERMSFLKIDQASFDTERKVVEEERRLYLNRPYGTMIEQVAAELYTVHPYRWMPIGRISHLRAASVAELSDFWQRYYVPRNAVLVVVGAVRHSQVQQLAQRYFGWIDRYPQPPRVTVREPAVTKGREITVQEQNAPAPLVGLGFRTVPVDHKDKPAIEMLASVLADGDSSRLHRKLVAESKLAIRVRSIVQTLEHDGLVALGVVLPVLGGDADNVVHVIEEEIESIRQRSVTERELLKVRNRMLFGQVNAQVSIGGKAAALGHAAVIRGDLSSVNRQWRAIRDVNRDTLQRVAQTYFDLDRGFVIHVKQNLPGAILSGFDAAQDFPEPAVAAASAPPPPRPGLRRPDGYPTVPPIKAGDGDLPQDRFSTARLPNGLKIMVVPNHEVPLVTVQLGLLKGSWSEPEPGVANMAMKLLTKGTANRTELQLAEELETYAITLSGSAAMDSAKLRAECLSEHLDRAVALLVDVLRNPSFPPDQFEKLRQQLRTELAITKASPNYLADREIRQRLYGQHPYARSASGELEDLDKIERDDISQWWRHAAQPDAAVLIFAGDVTLERAMSLAESSFMDWGGTDSTVVRLPAISHLAPTTIYLVDQPNSTQSQIRIAQPGITRDHDAFFTAEVVSAYFGGAFTSRLNETIRVKRGLTYGARGGFSARRFAGEFNVRSFSKTETTVEVVKAILNEIRRLREEPPSADELDRTTSHMLGSHALSRETPRQLADYLWFVNQFGLPVDYARQKLKAVANVSAADCQMLIDDTLDLAHCVIVVVGRAASLRDDLQKIAPVIEIKE